MAFAGEPHNAYRVPLHVHTDFGNMCETPKHHTTLSGKMAANLGNQVMQQILKEGSMAVHISAQLQINQTRERKVSPV